jgi:NADH-quinone oxidoreductase subunit N
MGSGMLLYGLSMLYGATQTLHMEGVASAITSTAAAHDLILVFALVFVLAGVAFKLGAVPFHMWVPDVYDGSPNSVTLFVSTAPKIAALAMTFRLLLTTMPNLAQQWQPMLIVLSIASMATGNLLAIAQTNFKRMLAYSSIAHIGYTLLGVIAVTQEGYGSALFYLLTYVFMTAAAFGLLTLLSRQGHEIQWIDDLQGLSERNPWLAFMMLLVMFSMAGIPPMVGFMAKVAVLEALISVNLIWLAALALVFAIIGAYYYIRVIKVMYFEKPHTQEPVDCPIDLKALASVNCLALLVLGLLPGGLFHLCHVVI